MALTAARSSQLQPRPFLSESHPLVAHAHRRICSTQSEAMAVKRKPVPKVICPACKIPMQERDDKAPVIQLSTRLKWVVFKCPKCSAETDRRMAV